MKITINGKQVWPNSSEPTTFAFKSLVNNDDGSLVYTENSVDNRGKPYGDPTIILEMNPKEVQSICFAERRSETNSSAINTANSVLKAVDKIRKDASS